MKRWSCPTCGRGVLAPLRMHADDVRRFCLDCSSSSKRLVRRTCVAHARAVEERGKARLERGQQRRAVVLERDRAADLEQFTVCGLDVRKLAHQLWPAFGPGRGALPRVRLRRRAGWTASGRAHSLTRTVWITVGSGCTQALLRSLMLHELAHIIVAQQRAFPRSIKPHGLEFNRVLRAAAIVAFGVDLPLGSGLGYDLSKRLDAALGTKAAIAACAPVGDVPTPR